MIWFPFKKLPKRFLGIDIGTSSIRVVELSRKGQNRFLENYGEIKTSSLQKAPFRVFEKNTLSLSNQGIAQAISSILKEAAIQTKEVNFSIPDFASFFTSFELPSMNKEEIPQAVRYEARNYIPLPLSEITFDWLVVEEKTSDNLKTALKVLVVAISNEVINQYQEIASLAGLNLKSLEAEAFSLSRALMIQNEKKVIAIVDIGARSTTCNILENGILKISHSFNFSGNELTEALSRSLRIDYEEAEEVKKNSGLFENSREILFPSINIILTETNRIFQNFYQQEGKEIEKIILAGGSVWLPGLKEYFFEELKKEIEIANPFSQIVYLSILEETLRETGPAYAIAVGLALKGLE